MAFLLALIGRDVWWV